MSQPVEERFAELEKLALTYAEAQATADHLEAFKHSKRAMLMKEAEIAGAKTTSAQEREAYAHKEYVALLDGLKVATQKALEGKWRLELARMRFEWARTKAANRRAEMNLR